MTKSAFAAAIDQTERYARQINDLVLSGEDRTKDLRRIIKSFDQFRKQFERTPYERHLTLVWYRANVSRFSR